MLLCACPHCPSLLPLPVPDEIKQADLITCKEHEELSDVTAVARVQDVKFPEMVSETADFLRGHGCDEEAKPIEGDTVIIPVEHSPITRHYTLHHTKLIKVHHELVTGIRGMHAN